MLLYKELGMQPADLEKRWHQYVAAVVRSHSLSTNPFGVGARLAPSGSTDRALVVNERNGGIVLDGAPVLSLTTAMLASSPSSLASSPSSGTSPSALVISPPTLGVDLPPGAISSASNGTAFAEAAALALSRGNH